MEYEDGFTGLEAAIVLIAFVVVAAVFSYVMLSAGFFSTQKSQEVTYAGIKQATSNLVPNGALYGEMDANDRLDVLMVYMTNPQGNQPINMSEIKFLIAVNDGPMEDISQLGVTGFLPGTIMPDGFTAQFYVHFAGYQGIGGPKAGDRFTLEIKPPVGPSVLYQRTLPSGYEGGVLD